MPPTLENNDMLACFKCAFGILIVSFMREGCIMYLQLALNSRKSSCLCTMSAETKGLSQMDKFHSWGQWHYRDPVLGWNPRPRVCNERKYIQKPAQSWRWLCTPVVSVLGKWRQGGQSRTSRSPWLNSERQTDHPETWDILSQIPASQQINKMPSEETEC